MSQHTGAVVVGVDGSSSAEHALAWAVDQAVAERRGMTLVHALGRHEPGWPDFVVDGEDVAYADLQQRGQDVLDAARRRVAERAPDLQVEEVLELVDARALLLQQSESAAMIVLGSHGRGPLRRVLLGSVGATVARHAECPVVVHRPHRGLVRNGVLVACDASVESRTVLEFAYHLAAVRRLPLTVLHCFWASETLSGEGYESEAGVPTDIAAEHRQLAEAVAGLQEKYPDVTVTRKVAHGVPQVQVVLAGERMDLVVVGAHHGPRLRQMVAGSVSLAVLDHATFPVAVVPVGWEQNSAR